MKAKTIARERALIFLYQEALGNDSDLIEDQELNSKEVDLRFFQQLISETHKNRDSLKDLINTESTRHKFKNQNQIDLSILLIALVEINHFDEKPSIVINEAIELAKKYSTIEGKNFIHAFLDKYVRGN